MVNQFDKNYDIEFRKEIESKILGVVIQFSNVLSVQKTIKDHNLLYTDFCSPIHKEIFMAIVECYEKKMIPNLINVSNFRPVAYRNNNYNIWEHPLITMINSAIEYASLEHHIMLLKQFVLMDFWNYQSHLMLYGNWNNKDIIETGSKVVENYETLFKRLTEVYKVDKTNDYEEEIVNKVKRLQEGKPVGISTTVPEIDDFTAGYSLGELFIVAARPGMGKTTFALISSWNASEQGAVTVFFSLEMPKNQLISKLVSLITKIDYKQIKAGKLTSEELQEVLAARRYIANSNFHIDDEAKTIEEISAKSAEYAKSIKARLIIVDYIQRTKTKERMDMRLQITVITRDLKSIAKDNYQAVIALSQLSRGVDKRDSKRPLLGDLKESSSIEEDADIVGFLFNQSYYDKQAGMLPIYNEIFHTEFIIGKGRDVGTKTIHLWIDPVKMFIAGYNPLGIYANSN